MLHHAAQEGVTQTLPSHTCCLQHERTGKAVASTVQRAAAAVLKLPTMHTQLSILSWGTCWGAVTHMCSVLCRVQGILPSGCLQGCLDIQISTPYLCQTRQSTSQTPQTCGNSSQGEDCLDTFNIIFQLSTCVCGGPIRSVCLYLGLGSYHLCNSFFVSAGKEGWSRHGALHNSMM